MAQYSRVSVINKLLQSPDMGKFPIVWGYPRTEKKYLLDKTLRYYIYTSILCKTYDIVYDINNVVCFR